MDARLYETLIILKSIGTDAELSQAAAQTEEAVKKLGGKIVKATAMGRRRLTYRINHQAEGSYHLIQFELEAERIEELKRAFRLNERIIRFLILNRDEEPEPQPMTSGSAHGESESRSSHR